MINYRDYILEAAEAAYRGYVRSTKGKSLVTGDLLPEWRYLHPNVKMCWVATAEAVMSFKHLTQNEQISYLPNE